MALAASRKKTETALEPSLAEVVQKTGLLIRDLKSRLDSARAATASPGTSVLGIGHATPPAILTQRIAEDDAMPGAAPVAGAPLVEEPALSEAAGVRPPPAASNAASADASADELEEQLQHYFTVNGGETATGNSEGTESDAHGEASANLEAIRDRVIDGVVEKIIREWEHANGEARASLEGEVMDRLVRKVLERLNGPSR